MISWMILFIWKYPHKNIRQFTSLDSYFLCQSSIHHCWLKTVIDEWVILLQKMTLDLDFDQWKLTLPVKIRLDSNIDSVLITSYYIQYLSQMSSVIFGMTLSSILEAVLYETCLIILPRLWKHVAVYTKFLCGSPIQLCSIICF